MKFEDFLLVMFSVLVVLALNALLFGVGVLILTWAWNVFFSSVFKMPTISYVHGVAIAILLGTIQSSVNVVLKRGN